jgi:hypothetical protein
MFLQGDKMRKSIQIVCLVTAIVSFPSVAKSDIPLATKCANANADVYISTTNVTAAWNTYVTAQLPTLPITSIATNFSEMKCPGGTWTGGLALFLSTHRSCVFQKPQAVVSGTTINYGGANPANPATVTKSGCKVKIGDPSK